MIRAIIILDFFVIATVHMVMSAKTIYSSSSPTKLANWSNISSTGNFYLSKGMNCVQLIKIPRDQAVFIDFKLPGSHHVRCDRIQDNVKLMEYATEELLNICDSEQPLTGGDKGIALINLPEPLIMSVAYKKTAYKCGDMVHETMADIPLTLHINKEYCSLRISPLTKVTVYQSIPAEYDNTECQKTYQFYKGDNFNDLRVEGPKNCLGTEFTELDVCAGGGRIDFRHAVGDTVTFKLKKYRDNTLLALCPRN